MLKGNDLKRALDIVEANHYAHSIPSGKTYAFCLDAAIVLFSVPANKNIAKFLLGFPGVVWELTRLWAPNGHEKNLLTRAISYGVRQMCQVVPKLDALVSYADPNVGHAGGVYRAASWIYTGQSEEGRYYKSKEGQVVARRKFHSGKKSMTKAQILALGYEEFKMPGKHRFAFPISKNAKRALARFGAMSIANRTGTKEVGIMIAKNAAGTDLPGSGEAT